VIYRMQIIEGIPFDPERENREMLGLKLQRARQTHKPIMLAPRQEPYVVTPEFSHETVFLHFVTPDMNGSGLFKRVEIPVQEIEKGGHLLYVPGEAYRTKNIVLPDERPWMLIEDKTTSLIRIVDVIYYYPGVPVVDPAFPFSVN